MNTMRHFYQSLPGCSPIVTAAAEHARLDKIFKEDATNGEELPLLFAAATRLRQELEDLSVKPEIVVSYIGLLDADVRLFRSIVNSLKKGTA